MAFLQLPKILRSTRNLNNSSSRRRRRQQKKRSSSLAGVFFRQAKAERDDTTVGSCSEDTDSHNNDSDQPQSLSSSQAVVSWKSTTRKSFCKNQPLIAADPDSSKDFTAFDSACVDDKPVVMLHQAMARELPESSWYYSSNHVMVNCERRQWTVAPLTRLATLDAMARQHAQAMADSNKLYHADPQQMIETFTSMTTTTTTRTANVPIRATTTPERTYPSSPTTTTTASPTATTTTTTNVPKIRIMGENVATGDSIRAIHAKMMQNATHRINILHRGYTHFGVGTAKCRKTGHLYLCQVYRG